MMMMMMVMIITTFLKIVGTQILYKPGSKSGSIGPNVNSVDCIEGVWCETLQKKSKFKDFEFTDTLECTFLLYKKNSFFFFFY